MAYGDRLSFLAEWQDPFSSLHWKFNLFFYPFDETLELFDTTKHRVFLKRKKCERVQLQDMYIGSTVKICSRLIRITDYADSFTRCKVESDSQKICGFLKPEIVDHKGQILKSFLSRNLRLINVRTIILSESEAYELLKEHTDEAVLNSAVYHVISGPIVAFQLLGPNALTECLNLIGPEDPVEARREFPESLRAQYGTDKIKNALYLSANLHSAENDAKILFYSANDLCNYLNQGESICCIIKPHAVRKGHVGAIMSKIEEAGYRILNVKMCTMSTEEAEKFLAIYKYVVAEFQEIVQEFCWGSCVVMEINSGTEEKTFADFRNLVGPMDPEIARFIRAGTIRAIFGETKVCNAVHVTDLVEDLSKEIRFFFKRNSGIA